MLCVLMKIVSCTSAKEKTKRPKRFKFGTGYWSFLRDIVAVTGLKAKVIKYSGNCVDSNIQ